MSDEHNDALVEAISKPLVRDDDSVFMARIATTMRSHNASKNLRRVGLITASAVSIALAGLTAEAVLWPLFDSMITANPLLGVASGLAVLSTVLIILMVRAD